MEQDIEQIPNPLQGVKALNSFYMDMGWIVMAVNALGIYCIGFGIQHLMGSRGIISIAIGLVLLIGMWLAYVVKIVADKRVINRLTAILDDVDSVENSGFTSSVFLLDNVYISVYTVHK